MKSIKRIIAFISVLTIVFSFVAVPAHAEGELVTVGDGWIMPDAGGAGAVTPAGAFFISSDMASTLINQYEEWYSGVYDTISDGARWLYSKIDSSYCAEAENHRHSLKKQHTIVDGVANNYYICEHCGKSGGEVLEAAYSDTVADMPVNGIDSSGSFLWYPDYRNIKPKTNYSPTLLVRGTGYGAVSCPYDASFPYNFSKADYTGYFTADSDSMFEHSIQNSGSFETSSPPYFEFSVVAPVSGTYTSLAKRAISGFATTSSNIKNSFHANYPSKTSTYTKDSEIPVVYYSYDLSYDIPMVRAFYVSVDFNVFYPVYSVVPATAPDSSLYVPDTRPASITGDYGILGDNNQLTKVDSQTIVNETDNSVYNPVTNTTSTVNNWQYDYSTRTYDLTLDTGDKMTVTYGDEYVTIQEGDTVYNVYYIIQQEETSPSVPDGHKHNYTATTTREPTCTTKGIATYTCEECGNTYQENTAALGHDWVIKEQVPTVYGETGEVETSGYTIYECTRCHETYKSTDGTVPDSGGGGELAVPDMTGELGSYWERVKGFFIALPEMFGDLTEFLHEGWSYVPDEVMTLIEFGLSMVVLVGIINWLFKR